MNILIDVDEVLRSLMREVLRVYKEKYDMKSQVKFNDIVTRDLTKIMDKTPFNANEFFVHHPEVYKKAKPYSGARKVTKELAKDNNVIIVTEQPIGLEGVTLDWVHDQKITYNSIVFTKNKNIVKGDILIDDALHHLSNFDGLGICMSKPWNIGWEGIKVVDLEEVLGVVEEINKQKI